jgi:hypothetical protein
MLRHRPILAAVTTSAAAAAVGDVLAQTIEYGLGRDGAMDIDWQSRLLRTGGAATFGALVIGLGGEVWFQALAKKFPGRTYESVVRLTLDQALFAPVALLLAVGFLPLVEGRGLVSARAHLDADWMHMLGKLWTFWTLSGIGSYLLTPPKFQPAVALGSTFMWTAFVSYRLHTLTPVEMGNGYTLPVQDYLRDHRSEMYQMTDAPATAGRSARALMDDGPTGSQLGRAEHSSSTVGGKPKPL